MDLLDTLNIFSLAEALYNTMKESKVFIVEPVNFSMPFLLPQHNAKAFAVIRNGTIGEIEIHYAAGGREILRINQLSEMTDGHYIAEGE